MKHDALLSGPQRLRLSVLAAGIEDAVAEIEHLLAREFDQPLTRFADDLPPGCARRLRPHLESVRAQLVRMKTHFSLEPRDLSRVASIQAQVSAQMVCIDESGVKELRGYGAVAPGLDALLGPALRELRSTFSEMSVVLHQGV